MIKDAAASLRRGTFLASTNQDLQRPVMAGVTGFGEQFVDIGLTVSDHDAARVRALRGDV